MRRRAWRKPCSFPIPRKIGFCSAKIGWCRVKTKVEKDHTQGMSSKFESIQACRLAAAAMILWVHFRYVIGPETSDSWWVQTGMGGFGVDLFFVISGFVMVVCTKDRGLTRKRFLESRFIRILPLYILFSIPYVVKDVQSGAGPARLINTFAFFPVIDVGHYGGTSHPFGWTIAFEIWFYFLFSVTLLNRKEAAVLKISALLAAVSLLVGYLYIGSWFLPRFLSCPLLLEFLSGCLIAEIHSKIGRKSAWILLISAFLLYFGVVPRYDYLTYYSEVIISHQLSFLRFVAWGLPAALFCLALTALEAQKQLKTPKLLVALGNASFSLYLAQPYFVVICRKYFVFENLMLTALIYIIFSIANAFLLSRYLEFPILRKSRKFFMIRAERKSIPA